MATVLQRPRVVTPAAAGAAAVSELRTLGRLDPADPSDADLVALLGDAVAIVETRTNRALIHRTVVFSASGWGDDGRLIFPVGPVVSVVAVRAVTDGGTVTVASGSYALETAAAPAVLAVTDLPALAGDVTWPVEVEAVIGYGATAAAVDADPTGRMLRLLARRLAVMIWDGTGTVDAATDAALLRLKLYATR